MLTTVLYYQPVWLVGVFACGLFIVAVEVAHGFGRAVRRRADGEAPKRIASHQGAMLGLLALVLAFTYSLASQRAEARKAVVLGEANALGTAYLRADLLAPPLDEQLREALRAYGRTRVLNPGDMTSEAALLERITESEAALDELWPIVTRAMASTAPSPRDTLVVSAVNEVIDLDTSRRTVGFDRLPLAIFGALGLIASATLGIIGFTEGRAGNYNRVAAMTICVILAGLVMLINDLDRPKAGVIQATDAPIRDVVNQMRAPPDVTP